VCACVSEGWITWELFRKYERKDGFCEMCSKFTLRLETENLPLYVVYVLYVSYMCYVFKKY